MNRERYADTTAEAAIGRVTQEQKLIERIKEVAKRQGYVVESIRLRRERKRGAEHDSSNYRKKD